MFGNQAHPLAWLTQYRQRGIGSIPNTYRAEYYLTDLIRANVIERAAAQAFLKEHGLVELRWEMTWADDSALPDELLVTRIANGQGYAIFVHGWTGNAAIWEDLPALTAQSNPNLISIAIDHNGFGASLFADSSPSLDSCNPPAAMRTLQDWVDLLKLRRQPGSNQPKVINFIGHSMGGATLFYLDPLRWAYGEATRFAIAPALLLEDEAHRLFYTTLGLGIGILQRLPFLEIVERFIKPTMVNTLTGGASEVVKQLHADQYAATPRGITGATFMAMGRLNNYEIAHDFRLMRVMLGHRDVLVGLLDMMDLLTKLEFPTANLHVVPGTHYLFSVGNEDVRGAYQHAQNRELVVEDILELHEAAYQMQRSGAKTGRIKHQHA